MTGKAATAALIATSALTPIACGDDRSTERPAAEPSAGWTIYNDAKRGFSVRLPSDWHRARHPVDPSLFDPRERLAIATYPLRRWPATCADATGRAKYLDLRPRDAFVTVQERGFDPTSAWRDFPPRPAHFHIELGVGTIEDGCAADGGAAAGMVNFTDARRHFDAIVFVGRSASRQTRRDALRVLDSLSFDPGVRPDWPVSP